MTQPKCTARSSDLCFHCGTFFPVDLLCQPALGNFTCEVRRQSPLKILEPE